MLSPRDFLQEECENVERSLNEALRHDYGGVRGHNFYQECKSRLTVITQQLKTVSDEDAAEIQEYAIRISRLSELIARIERSHLGEFSWPFAYALEVLALATCQGVDGNEPGYDPPIFAISAEGGLDAYQIHSEQEPIDLDITRRIFNVIFPRTLKYHVLFHPILGHEIAHAANTVPSMQYQLTKDVGAKLEIGPFANEDSFRHWLNHQGWGAPSDDDSLLNMLDSWIEELMCDLFGLLIFGPSFLAAHRTLLSALDPNGHDPGDEHPPNVIRLDMLSKAAKHLNWNAQINVTNHHPSPVEFWEAILIDTDALPVWANIYTEIHVAKLVASLQTILDPLGALYLAPSGAQLNSLLELLSRDIPPVGCFFDERGKSNLTKIDFRTILYAGWIYWVDRERTPDVATTLTFFDLNRLCNHAIMQQTAIDRWCEAVD